MTQKILVKWNGDWADEMDIQGMAITTQVAYDKWASIMQDYYKEFEFSIGTNEEMYYCRGSDLVDEMTVTHITEIEALTIEKLFGTSFGRSEGILYIPRGYISVDDE